MATTTTRTTSRPWYAGALSEVTGAALVAIIVGGLMTFAAAADLGLGRMGKYGWCP